MGWGACRGGGGRCGADVRAVRPYGWINEAGGPPGRPLLKGFYEIFDLLFFEDFFAAYDVNAGREFVEVFVEFDTIEVVDVAVDSFNSDVVET